MTNASKANASFDLADLLEYDEFDGYDGAAATEPDNCMTINDNDYGVPLSVELSESMCQNNINRNELIQLQRANAIDTIELIASTDATISASSSIDDANNQPQIFLKSAEIFLRIDNNEESSTTTTITMASSAFNSNKQSVDSSIDTGGGGEPSSGQFSSSIDGGDVIELQYENEFFDPNDEESHFGESPTARRHRHHRHHLGGNVENDNEQLLLEGIFLLSLIFLCIQHTKHTHTQMATKNR